MLTGDSSVTSGEAWMEGHSIITEQLKVRQIMGYCPQFDALNDLLTGRQILTMYARIRGVPEDNVSTLVSWTINHLQLSIWADKMVQSYSGGYELHIHNIHIF